MVTKNELVLTIPRYLPTAAKKALHKLIDEFVITDSHGMGEGTLNEGSLSFAATAYRRTLESLPEPKKQLRYVEALLEAGPNGAKLSTLRAKTGCRNGKELGGISSSVTRNWRKIGAGMPDLVVRTHDWHFINRGLFPVLKAEFGK